jgi:hydrogenase maturation protease
MSLNPEPANGMLPVLVIGIGNPSRGDDAIGPLAIERLAGLALPATELLTDFQLQVEHALDLVGRREVVFIDAAASGPAPFGFEPVKPAAQASAITHALTPAAVLEAFVRVTDAPLPAAFVLAVRGYDFELGAALSDTAATNLDAALAMLTARLEATSRHLTRNGMDTACGE